MKENLEVSPIDASAEVARKRSLARNGWRARSTLISVMGLRSSVQALPLVLSLSCTGHVSAPGAGADAAPPTGLTGAAGGASVTPPGEQSLDCSTPKVAFAPLKRMTRQQYDNSMRDLLGIDTHPSTALSADEKLAAFYSNSVSPVTRLSVEQCKDG